MVARVQDQGQMSEPFSVTNGTKQGCAMAPLLSTLVFSAMFSDAFHDNDLGALIRFRTDGNVFTLQRLNSKTRTSKVLIKDLLFDLSRRRLNTFPSVRNRMSDPKSLSWNASLSMVENTSVNNSGAITQPCLVPFVTDNGSDVCP